MKKEMTGQVAVAIMAYKELLDGRNPFGLPHRSPCKPDGLSMWQRIALREEAPTCQLCGMQIVADEVYCSERCAETDEMILKADCQ